MKLNNLFILGLIAYSSVSIGGEIEDSCPQHVIYSAPKGEVVSQELCRIGYAVGYSYQYKDPVYSVVNLTAKNSQGNVKRKDSFKADSSIPAEHRATLDDYQGAPYDRGHMTSAGDLSWSYDSMIESFLLTNMVPQNPSINRGAFRKLEMTVRDWAVIHENLYVYTGPIFSEKFGSIGQGVAIPQHVYKIVYAPADNKAIAFIIPNTLNASVGELSSHIVSIEEIETKTGIEFFPTMPNDKKSVKKEISNMESWAK
jgi:endonuclease G, mitochondrial